MSIPQEPRDPAASPPDNRPPVSPGYPGAAGWSGGEELPRYTVPGPPPGGGPSTAGYPTVSSSAPPQYPQPGPFLAQYPPMYPGYPVVVQPARSNGLGVAGFVTGLLGLIFFWVPGLGLILGSLGTILGGVAYSAARKAGSNNGLAIAGLVLGIVSLIPAIIVLTALSNPLP